MKDVLLAALSQNITKKNNWEVWGSRCYMPLFPISFPPLWWAGNNDLFPSLLQWVLSAVPRFWEFGTFKGGKHRGGAGQRSQSCRGGREGGGGGGGKFCCTTK